MIKTIADGIRFLLEIATVVLLIIAGFNSSDLVVKLTVGCDSAGARHSFLGSVHGPNVASQVANNWPGDNGNTHIWGNVVGNVFANNT
ncbi:hypothetical protein Lpp43_06434 [Lacticaseibacillus paracasei subsp. paracasei Lpp43]|nr:hypothetical protein Lpp43_06434 [Lacticaseibacillus paracasei subsp. paracasei Lpp43]